MKKQKLKRYRLGLSRTFPSTHPMKGEETGFPRKSIKCCICNTRVLGSVVFLFIELSKF